MSGTQMLGSQSESEIETKAYEPDVQVKHGSCDLVIMNPPFTRLINKHEDEQVGLPAFAAFRTSPDEQQAMSTKLTQMERVFGRDSSGGHVAHTGSFLDLAHVKLREGGVLALILPFIFVAGKSWENARKELRSKYRDILILSIAAEGLNKQAFSADTSIAECMVIATKGAPTGEDVRFVTLDAQPSGSLDAISTAKSVLNSAARLNEFKGSFQLAGILNADVARSLRALHEGKVLLPRQASPAPLAMTELRNVADRGVSETAIYDTPPQGAFDLHRIKDPSDAPLHPTYPALWGHHAARKDGERERRFVVPIDAYCTPRKGMQEKAAEVWSRTAHVLHSTRDFSFGSQSFAMCLTEEPSLGGRGWPNVLPREHRYMIPLLLWSNSSLGLMSFWFFGSRQQKGRASVTLSRLPELPVLDVRILSDDQIEKCELLFDQFKTRVFLSAREAFRDEARIALDSALFDILQLPKELDESLDLLRRQWRVEPSVGGRNIG